MKYYSLAAENNRNVEILKYLVSQGLDVNAKDKKGKTPLSVAGTKDNKSFLRECQK